MISSLETFNISATNRNIEGDVEQSEFITFRDCSRVLQRIQGHEQIEDKDSGDEMSSSQTGPQCAARCLHMLL